MEDNVTICSPEVTV